MTCVITIIELRVSCAVVLAYRCDLFKRDARNRIFVLMDAFSSRLDLFDSIEKTNVLPSTVTSCFFVAGDAPSWREVGEPTIASLPNRPTSKGINHHDEHQEKHKGSYCALCDRGHAVRCVCPFDIPVIHNNTCYHLSETIISQHQSKSSQHGIRPSRIGIS